MTRIEDGKGNYLSIFPHLSVAKSTGIYEDITSFVLKNACQALLTSKRDISINVSILDIINPKFVNAVLNEKEKIQQAQGTLIFEILETDDIIEIKKCKDFVQLVKFLGCKVAIDDFGSGYFNMAETLSLPIDILKIDGSLISRVPYDEHAKTLVRGISQHCQKFNKLTVAGFVEDEKIFNAVKEMEIDYSQGFYLGEPVKFAT